MTPRKEMRESELKGYILQSAHSDSKKSSQNSLYLRFLPNLPRLSCTEKPSRKMREDATIVQKSSSLSDCKIIRTIKHRHQSTLEESESPSSTLNKTTLYPSSKLSTNELLEKTRNLQGHRSLYPSVSSIFSNYDKDEAQNKACRQNSISNNGENDSRSRCICVETRLFGFRRNTQSLFDDTDDACNEPAHNHFCGNYGNAPIQSGLQENSYVHKHSNNFNSHSMRCNQRTTPNASLDVPKPSTGYYAAEAHYNPMARLIGTSLPHSIESIEDIFLSNEAFKFLEKKTQTKNLPSILSRLPNQRKFLTDNDEDRWRPSPRRRGGDY